MNPPPTSLATAGQPFARSVFAALVVLALVAVAGPLVGYRADVAESRRALRARVGREASIYAGSVWLHLALLIAELERVAVRPEIDLKDERLEPEQTLLHLAHHDSALFKGGVALLDATGAVLWSEPRELFAPGAHFGQSRWFQRVLGTREAVVDAFESPAKSFIVSVPVLRNDRYTGFLVGLVSASEHLLPPRAPDELVLILTRAGEVIRPTEAPAWASQKELPERVGALLASHEGATWTLGNSETYAVAEPIGDSGLNVVVLADEEPLLAPIRSRLLLQLLFGSLVQLLTLGLFALFLRRTFRTFRAVELRVAEQEKMAALGTAASLIAHEVKNSLNGLNAATSLLATGADPALPVKSMRGQIDRLGHLARSLLAFGKPAVPRLSPVRLDQVVREALEGVRNLPEADEVKLEAHCDEPLEIEGDPLLLVTAVDNLLRNAIEAAVQAKDVGGQSPPWVSVRTRTEGAGALVEVEDNAGGPPAQFEAHLFEPFATSKPKGIGLGLAMSRRAIEQQGGVLSFERTREGSRFTVRMPRRAAR